MILTFKLISPFATGIDSGPLDSAVALGSQAQLSRFGAFVRRSAQTSLRYRKAASKPGQPPTARRSPGFTRLKTSKKLGEHRQAVSPLRELIAFSVIPDGKGFKVLIGPMLFRSSVVGGGIVPRRLEEGGDGQFLDSSEGKRGSWEARPYMGPAFRREVFGAAGLFDGSVRK